MDLIFGQPAEIALAYNILQLAEDLYVVLLISVVFVQLYRYVYGDVCCSTEGYGAEAGDVYAYVFVPQYCDITVPVVATNKQSELKKV